MRTRAVQNSLPLTSAPGACLVVTASNRMEVVKTDMRDKQDSAVKGTCVTCVSEGFMNSRKRNKAFPNPAQLTEAGFLNGERLPKHFNTTTLCHLLLI